MFAGFPFGMTTPKTVIPFGMTKSDFNCKPSFASALVRIFDFVLDTPARQCSFSCTFSRLGNSNKFDCARLIENVQINLTLPSLIRIFDCVLDTPSRHNQACACFCARLFVSLSSKPDSGRPRSVDDASATDAASGSQKRRSWDSTR